MISRQADWHSAVWFIHELHCFLLFITSVLSRIIIIIASFRSPYFVNISVRKHGLHNWLLPRGGPPGLLLIRMRVNMASCQQNPISDQTKTCYANKNTWEVVSWIFHSLTSIRRTLLRYCQVAAWWRNLPWNRGSSEISEIFNSNIFKQTSDRSGIIGPIGRHPKAKRLLVRDWAKTASNEYLLLCFFFIIKSGG